MKDHRIRIYRNKQFWTAEHSGHPLHGDCESIAPFPSHAKVHVVMTWYIVRNPQAIIFADLVGIGEAA